jgi:hypothetical protein
MEEESLEEFAHPEKIRRVKENYEKRRQQTTFQSNGLLRDTFMESCEDDPGTICTICHL